MAAARRFPVDFQEQDEATLRLQIICHSSFTRLPDDYNDLEPERSAIIRGRVSDRGEPVADAEVIAHITSGGGLWSSNPERTRPDGTFELLIPSYEADNGQVVELSAEHAGFELFGETNVRVTPRETVDTSIKMSPSPRR